MTQLEAALLTLLLIAITVALQCAVLMVMWRRQYRDMESEVLRLAGILDRYKQAWERARTP